MKLKDCLPSQMTRAAAVGYVDWLNKEGRSQRTKAAVPLSYNSKKDRVAALSAFWNGMEKRSALRGANPWANLQVTEKPTSDPSIWSDLSNTGRPKKRPSFSTDDLLAILNGQGPSGGRACQHSKRQMLEVLTLALLTGARLEEVCSRKLKDLSKESDVYWMTIHDSKNAASDRTIPISHGTGVALIDRLVGDRTDGEELLFDGLTPAKTDGTHSRNIGKALQRLFREDSHPCGDPCALLCSPYLSDPHGQSGGCQRCCAGPVCGPCEQVDDGSPLQADLCSDSSVASSEGALCRSCGKPNPRRVRAIGQPSGFRRGGCPKISPRLAAASILKASALVSVIRYWYSKCLWI